MGGTIDGRFGDHVLLAPPFISSESELEQIAELLASAIDQAVAQVGAA
jgi:adenosylmethionine-8-amino-7-oxononanoate aminotransferase